MLKKPIVWITLLGLLWICAWLVFLRPQYDIPNMVRGTVMQPFAGRALLLCLTRLTHDVTGLPIEPIIFALMAICFAGFCPAFKRLAISSGFSDKMANVALAVCLIVLPAFFGSAKLYDPATLFLTTWGLALMPGKKWAVYLWVFFLACVNRETALFLIPVFAVTSFKMEREGFLRLIFLQIVVFAAIRLVIVLIYMNNPGQPFGWSNVLYWRSAMQDYPVLFLAAVLALGIAVIYKWDERPPFLRIALAILLPASCVAHILFGMPAEIRVYLEVYPVLLLNLFFLGNSLHVHRQQPG